jgi:membrane protease YdiL (CAAX protease family)
MKIKDYARRYPVRVYFCLAFIISWAGSWLTGGPTFMRGESVQPQDLGPMGLAVLAGPCLAGLAMCYLVDGRPGLQALFSRMKRWRVGGRWYAALLVFPILLLAVSLALSVWVSPELRPTFFAPGVLMGLFAGFIEEIGWMGFAYPKMRSKSGILRTCLSLGLLHALWHVWPDFVGNYQGYGKYWLPYFVGFFVHVMALRVLIVWVYANTESLLLSQLLHTSSSGFFVTIIPIAIAPANRAIFFPVYGLVLSAAAAIVVARYGKTLTRQPMEPQSV